MGYSVLKYDEFTVNPTVNKAVLGLSIVRLFLFFCIFMLNLNQTIQEVMLAKVKGKSLKNNPRFFTYLSITIYPFSRLFMISVFLGVDKAIDNGSYTAAISIWGTLFQYFEWTFIGAFWAHILYTFFIKKDIVQRNKKRVWKGIWVIVCVLVVWTIVQTIFNFYFLKIMNASYGAGQVIIVVGIGGYYLINGFFLYKAIRNTGTKNPQLEQSFRTIKKLALCLLMLVVGVFVLYIIQSPILGLKTYATSNYIFYMFDCFLEFTQLSIVMYSLGGNSYKNYFSIKRIKEIRSGSGTGKTGTSGQNSSAQTPSGIEVNLDDFETSSVSGTIKSSSSQLIFNGGGGGDSSNISVSIGDGSFTSPTTNLNDY